MRSSLLGNRNPLKEKRGEKKRWAYERLWRGGNVGGGGGEKLLALIFLDVSAVPLCDPGARKIAAEYDHLWDEIVFDAVIKDFL